MTNFSTIKHEVIWKFVLASIHLFLPLYLINQVYGQVAAQSGYNLIGTIRSWAFSGAVIKVEKGEQSFFRLFEKLPDGSQLVQMRDDSISIMGADDTLNDMFISHEKTSGLDAPPLANNDPPVNISPSILAAAPTNVSSDRSNVRTRRRTRHSSSEE
jgi:hypothetical protein